MEPDISLEQLIAWRRHFHMHPELSGQEQKTAEFIADELRGFGLSPVEHIAGHGLTAVLSGDPHYKCAAIRADMDALPLEEDLDIPYRSQMKGRMHACGHDAHMAMTLGAAKYLCANPPKGSVKFIFQPCEEKPPGGARFMIESGVLSDPKVDGIFGTHIVTDLPLGCIGLHDGPTMSLDDMFQLVIKGIGGHGAQPHSTVDVVVVAAQVITALQHIRSRRINTLEPLVLTIGSIHGGSRHNLIPDRIEMLGTVRCFNLEVEQQIHDYMRQTVSGICSAYEAEYELLFKASYPPLVNDSLMNCLTRKAAEGAGAKIEVMADPKMIAEDFAFYTQHIPASFFFTGAGSAKCTKSLHNPQFQIEEGAMLVGARTLALAATKLAGQRNV